MKNIILLCVFLFVSAVLGATRPVISQQFYAEVHVGINDDNRFLTGGGVISYDVPKNMGRQDLKFREEGGHVETFQFVERYDVHEVYEIVDNQNCNKVSVSGNIESPFAWVAQATYNGTVTFQNKLHDVWVLSYEENGSALEKKLLVAETDVNTPVYFSTHNVSAKSVYDTLLTFLSFTDKEPQSWVFNIPNTCNSTLVRNLKCNGGTIQTWANQNWNCGDVTCSYRVPDGSAQPGYACAEFTSRALAAGGYIGLQPTDPQSYYANYKGFNLLYVGYLSDYCQAAGFSSVSPTPSAVQAGYAICGNGGSGSWSHACIGVGPGLDDCHNIARMEHPASGSFGAGINALWAPPGC